MLPSTSTFESFRSLRHQLAWLSNCRPDFTVGVNILSQVTDSKFDKSHIKEINRIVKHLRIQPSLGLPFPKLDLDSLRMMVFTDVSFANTEYLSSQIGFLVFLQDKSGRTNCIYFSSRKSKCVVRSVLGSDIFAFSDAVDIAILLRFDVQQILKTEHRSQNSYRLLITLRRHHEVVNYNWKTTYDLHPSGKTSIPSRRYDLNRLNLARAQFGRLSHQIWNWWESALLYENWHIGVCNRETDDKGKQGINQRCLKQGKRSHRAHVRHLDRDDRTRVRYCSW